MLGHIAAFSISKHFTDQNILFGLQHGFREKRSCETQLMLVDELVKNMQSGKQTDLFLFDFSKISTKSRMKTHFETSFLWGITLNWIKNFLDRRTQSVLLNGTDSDNIPVSSGAPWARFSVPCCSWLI